MFYYNCYLFAVLLVLVGSYPISEAVSENKNILTLGERVIKILEKKCADTAGETVYNNLKNDLENIKNDCFNLYIGAEKITDENLTTELCQNQNAKFLQCLATFTEKVDPCLDPSEKDIKELILNIFKDATEYFCAHIGILDYDKVLKADTVKCIITMKEHPEIKAHSNNCFENSTIIGDNPTQNIITKEKLCHDLEQRSSCFYDIVKEHCPGTRDSMAIQQGLLNSAMSNCVPIIYQSTTVKMEHPTSPSTPPK